MYVDNVDTQAESIKMANGLHSDKELACTRVVISAVDLHTEPVRYQASAFRPYAHRTGPLLALLAMVLALAGLLEYGFYNLPQTNFDLSSGRESVKRDIRHAVQAQTKYDDSSRLHQRQLLSAASPLSNRLIAASASATQPISTRLAVYTNTDDKIMSLGVTEVSRVRAERPQESVSPPVQKASLTTLGFRMATPYLKPSMISQSYSLEHEATTIMELTRISSPPEATSVRPITNTITGAIELPASFKTTRTIEILTPHPIIYLQRDEAIPTESITLPDICPTYYLQPDAITITEPLVLPTSLEATFPQPDPNIFTALPQANLGLSTALGLSVPAAMIAPSGAMTTDYTASISSARPDTPATPVKWISNVPLTLVQTPLNYFLGVYSPVIVSVILRLAFGYLYRCTKLAEPFFMLTQPGGVSLEDLFAVDHLGNESILDPFHALRSKRWILLSVSFIYAGTQLLTALAGELLSIHHCRYSITRGEVRISVLGEAFWINSVVGRIMETILLLIAAVLIVVWAMLRKLTTEVSTNPASVGTIMSLNSHPCLVEDTLRITAPAKKARSSKTAQRRHYMLDYYISKNGDKLYGIVPIESNASRSNKDSSSETTESDASFRESESRTSSQIALTASDTGSDSGCGPDQSSIMQKLRELFFLILFTSMSAALFGIVLWYIINTAPTPFEQFMDTGGFGARFLLASLALLLKSPLLSLSAAATAGIPFRRLSRRPMQASSDLLAPVPLTPQGAVWYALRRREWLAAGLAVAGGVAVEVLIVLIPGVPYHPSQLWRAAITSWYGCLACLCLCLLVAVAVWVDVFRRGGGRRRCRPSARDLAPRAPPADFTYFGAVCRHTAGSRAAEDFAVGLVAAEQRVADADKGHGVNGEWMAEVGRADARYDFRLCQGRWLLDYASSTEEVSASPQPVTKQSVSEQKSTKLNGLPSERSIHQHGHNLEEAQTQA